MLKFDKKKRYIDNEKVQVTDEIKRDTCIWGYLVSSEVADDA